MHGYIAISPTFNLAIAIIIPVTTKFICHHE